MHFKWNVNDAKKEKTRTKMLSCKILEYQESVMTWKIKPNNTGYFPRTLFEKALRILKESKYAVKTDKAFVFKLEDLFTISYLFFHLYHAINIDIHSKQQSAKRVA